MVSPCRTPETRPLRPAGSPMMVQKRAHTSPQWVAFLSLVGLLCTARQAPGQEAPLERREPHPPGFYYLNWVEIGVKASWLWGANTAHSFPCPQCSATQCQPEARQTASARWPARQGTCAKAGRYERTQWAQERLASLGIQGLPHGDPLRRVPEESWHF